MTFYTDFENNFIPLRYGKSWGVEENNMDNLHCRVLVDKKIEMDRWISQVTTSKLISNVPRWITNKINTGITMSFEERDIGGNNFWLNIPTNITIKYYNFSSNRIYPIINPPTFSVVFHINFRVEIITLINVSIRGRVVLATTKACIPHIYGRGARVNVCTGDLEFPLISNNQELGTFLQNLTASQEIINTSSLARREKSWSKPLKIAVANTLEKIEKGELKPLENM